MAAVNYLWFAHPFEGGALEALLLIDNPPVPPIIDNDHVLAFVVVGLIHAVRQVHNERAVETSGTLASEMAVVEVGPGLHIIINQNSQSVKHELMC